MSSVHLTPSGVFNLIACRRHQYLVRATLRSLSGLLSLSGWVAASIPDQPEPPASTELVPQCERLARRRQAR